MKDYITPIFEVVNYVNDEVLQTSEEYQKNGNYNAEGSASGWIIDDTL